MTGDPLRLAREQLPHLSSFTIWSTTIPKTAYTKIDFPGPFDSTIPTILTHHQLPNILGYG